MTVAAFGTQTATIGTEHTLSGASFTTAGTYVLTLDTTNMVLGDRIEIRASEKVLTGGTEKLVYVAVYKHVQAQVVKISPPIPSAYSCKFTLKQTTGTGRAFDFRIDTI